MNEITKKRKTIIWERTKKPIIFVSVCLAAAFALKCLYDFKTAYTETRDAPYVIFDDLKQNEEQTLFKAVQTSKLIDKINKDKDKSLLSSNEVSKTVSNLKSNQFKDADELIKTLNDEFTKSRTKALEQPLIEFDNAQQNLQEFQADKTNDIKFLENKIKATPENEPVSIDQLLSELTIPKKNNLSSEKNANAETIPKYLVPALKKIKDETNSDIKKSELSAKVKSNITESLTNNLTSKSASINKIENNYDTVKTNIYDIKKDMSSLLFPSIQASEYKNLDRQKYEMKYLFLDDKGGFSMLFKLIELTLTAILVFGLLYIVIIPLKYIFFLSTSADILTDKAKGYLERKNDAVGLSEVGKALLLTAGTVTLGAAVVVNSNSAQGLFSSDSDRDSKTEKSIAPNKFDKNSMLPTDSTDKNSANQFETITRLTKQIESLNNNITSLYDKIENLEFPEVIDVSNEIKEINGNLAKLNTAFGSDELINGQSDANNLPKFINKSVGQIKSFDNTGLAKDITELKNKIATEQEFKADSKSIFKRMEEIENSIKNPPFEATITDISDTLGTNQFKNLTSLDKSEKTLFRTISEVSEDLGNRDDREIIFPSVGNTVGKNTLFGKINNVFTAIDPANYIKSESSIFTTLGSNRLPVDDNVYSYVKSSTVNTKDFGEAGRLLIKDSGNTETFFARLFEGKQYFLNQFLVTELEKKANRLDNEILLNDKSNDPSKISQNPNIAVEISDLKLLISALNSIINNPLLNRKKYSEKEICKLLLEKLETQFNPQERKAKASKILKDNILTILNFSHVSSY